MEESKQLTLKEKIFQKFILGFKGTQADENIKTAIASGVGGVILFSENIESYEQTAKLTKSLQNMAKIPLFMSIDQEGGRVERTINIKNKINYLAPLALAQTGEPENVRLQAETMARELKTMGVNMNFAPVLDVNTNPNNPIIGVRSFGDNPETVIKYAKPVYETFMGNKIIPVVKHFPGHGDTAQDSHLTMPRVDLDFEELEKLHIEPFKKAFADGVPAVMVAHAHYKAFGKEIMPASLSENVINRYLRGTLGFRGLIISDDMIMGGIKNYYTALDACVKGIEAGIDLFIFRNSDETILSLIHKLVEYTKNGLLSEEIIDKSVDRILVCKSGIKPVE